jgi:two-component system, NtrC family, sensor kinase
MGEFLPSGFQIGIELSSDAMLIADAGGRVTFANSAAEQLFGSHPLLGQYIDTLFATGIESAEAHIARALQGMEQRVPAEVKSHTGERRAILLRLAPIMGGEVPGKGTNGQSATAANNNAHTLAKGVVAVFEDVTDEFRARQAIAKSEMRYRNIFDGASDAIYTLDASGAFTSVNGATCEMSGYSHDELIGRSLAPFLDEEERPAIIEHFRAARGGEPRHFECHVTRKDGLRLLCSVTHTPVRSDDEIVGVLGIARDVTGQRRAALEREQLRRQLGQSQKLEAIGQLVSGVAHELNNPLAAVMAYAQLALASASLPADERSAVETILHESKRAARIVSNLLTFARQHQPERSVTDVNQVVNDTVALRRYALSEHNITLMVQLDEDLPLTWADGFQVQQVLLNLVANAEQALHDWDGERRITVRTEYNAQTIRLTVADSGYGIDDATLDQIFNPFFTTKSVGDGTGLGLSIADGIVREHGGSIRVESTPGHGATFIVELPFVDPATGFLYNAARDLFADSARTPERSASNASWAIGA